MDALKNFFFTFNRHKLLFSLHFTGRRRKSGQLFSREKKLHLWGENTATGEKLRIYGKCCCQTRKHKKVKSVKKWNNSTGLLNSKLSFSFKITKKYPWHVLPLFELRTSNLGKYFCLYFNVIIYFFSSCIGSASHSEFWLLLLLLTRLIWLLALRSRPLSSFSLGWSNLSHNPRAFTLGRERSSHNRESFVLNIFKWG